MKKRELNQEETSLYQAETDSSVENGNDEPHFIQKNGKIISIVSLAVVIIIGVAMFMRHQSEKDSARAAVLLTRVIEYYENADYEKALNGDPTRTYMGEEVKGLKYIADEFSGTDQGKIAALYTANALYNTNKIADSKKYYEIAEKSSANVIKQGALAGIAASLELEGKYTDAAQYYINSSKLSEVDNIKSRYLLYAGLCYEKATDTKQAETIYRDILKISEFGEFSTLAKAGLTRIGTIIE